MQKNKISLFACPLSLFSGSPGTVALLNVLLCFHYNGFFAFRYSTTAKIALLDQAVNTVTVIPPSGIVDPDMSNNTVTRSDAYRILLLTIFK